MGFPWTIHSGSTQGMYVLCCVKQSLISGRDVIVEEVTLAVSAVDGIALHLIHQEEMLSLGRVCVDRLHRVDSTAASRFRV